MQAYHPLPHDVATRKLESICSLLSLQFRLRMRLINVVILRGVRCRLRLTFVRSAAPVAFFSHVCKCGVDGRPRNGKRVYDVTKER